MPPQPGRKVSKLIYPRILLNRSRESTMFFYKRFIVTIASDDFLIETDGTVLVFSTWASALPTIKKIDLIVVCIDEVFFEVVCVDEWGLIWAPFNATIYLPNVYLCVISFINFKFWEV